MEVLTFFLGDFCFVNYLNHVVYFYMLFAKLQVKVYRNENDKTQLMVTIFVIIHPKQEHQENVIVILD